MRGKGAERQKKRRFPFCNNKFRIVFFFFGSGEKVTPTTGTDDGGREKERKREGREQ